MHLLESLFVKLALCDQVWLSTRPGVRQGKVSVSLSGPFAFKGKNIAERASKILLASCMNRKTTCIPNIDIHIAKNIPIGAGLGGASSNAAAILQGLAVLWNIDICKEDLLKIGAQIGADVPFFLHNKQAAFITSIGEKIQSFKGRGNDVMHLLLVKPEKNLLTQRVFQEFTKSENTYSLPLIAEICTNNQQLQFSVERGRNDLEKSAVKLLPEIASILSTIKAQPGCKTSRMSGSGSACFGIFEDAAAAKAAQQIAQSLNYWTYQESIQL